MSDSVREAVKEDPIKMLGFLLSAIRCGDEFGEPHETASRVIHAALSANGGEVEPVAWVVFADNGNIRIWGREKPEAFPDAAPLYLSPTVKDSLTVQSEPIGYADPDTLADYRAGDRLHMPVYRPDASADWQDGIPVYLHPAPPSVAVPELTVRVLSFPESNGKRNWTAMLVRKQKWGGLAGNCGGITIHRGELWNRVAYAAECAKLLLGERETEPDIFDYGDDIETPDQWPGEVRAGRPVKNSTMLTAAPSPDHIADAGKVDGVDGWPGSITRSQAIKILDRATDKDDPHWEFVVDDFYDEDSDTMPSIFHVFAAIGVTEEEYREAAGVQNIDWPASATPSVPENDNGVSSAYDSGYLDAMLYARVCCDRLDNPENTKDYRDCARFLDLIFKSEIDEAARLRTAGDEGVMKSALAVNGPHAGQRVLIRPDAEFWTLELERGETFRRVEYQVFPMMMPGRVWPVAWILALPGTESAVAYALWREHNGGESDHG
jgi:hypothetical protein